MPAKSIGKHKLDSESTLIYVIVTRMTKHRRWFRICQTRLFDLWHLLTSIATNAFLLVAFNTRTVTTQCPDKGVKNISQKHIEKHHFYISTSIRWPKYPASSQWTFLLWTDPAVAILTISFQMSLLVKRSANLDYYAKSLHSIEFFHVFMLWIVVKAKKKKKTIRYDTIRYDLIFSQRSGSQSSIGTKYCGNCHGCDSSASTWDPVNKILRKYTFTHCNRKKKLSSKKFQRLTAPILSKTSKNTLSKKGKTFFLQLKITWYEESIRKTYQSTASFNCTIRKRSL